MPLQAKFEQINTDADENEEEEAQHTHTTQQCCFAVTMIAATIALGWNFTTIQSGSQWDFQSVARLVLWVTMVILELMSCICFKLSYGNNCRWSNQTGLSRSTLLSWLLCVSCITINWVVALDSFF